MNKRTHNHAHDVQLETAGSMRTYPCMSVLAPISESVLGWQ